MNVKFKWMVLTLICALSLFGRAASAQVKSPIIDLPPSTEHSGPYLWGIGGHEIINVKAGITESSRRFNCYERCSILDRRTVEILSKLQAPPLRASDVKVFSDGRTTMIIVRRFILTEVTPADARADRTTVAALAQKWMSSVRSAYNAIKPAPPKYGI